MKKATAPVQNALAVLKGRVECFDIARLWGRLVERLREYDRKLEKVSFYPAAKRLLGLLRSFLKLLIFLLAPAFLLFYGLELRLVADARDLESSDNARHYLAAGWILITLGCLLCGLLITAALSRVPEGKPAEGVETKASGNDKGWIGAILVSVDVIAFGVIVVMVLLMPAHEFGSAPLRVVQNWVHYLIHDQTEVAIVGVTNNADEAVEFIVRHNEGTVSVRVIGEKAKIGKQGQVEWVDSGWIEDSKERRVWDMDHGNPTSLGHDTYDVADDFELKPGRYVLKYRSDGSDSVNLCKNKQDPKAPPRVAVLSRQDGDKDKDKGENKEKEPPPAFSTCLKIKVTVKR